MKSDWQRWIGRAFFALAALMCAASLALPCALAAWEDSRLYAAAVLRPAVAGALSSRGGELTVAYELYRKRLLSGEEITPKNESADPAGAVETFCEKTKALSDAGVLPAAAAQEILTRLPGAKLVLAGGQDGVNAISCGQWKDAENSEQPDWWYDVQWLASCDLVTSYAATIPTQDVDAETVLRVYRTYLGLDVLTDWQTFDASSLAPDTATMWSAEAQTYLYCSAGQEILSFGVLSVTQDSLPQM